MSINVPLESDLLEALAESKTASECLMVAYDVLEDGIDSLLKSIFYKDDYAVKYVVEPLLTSDGPLSDILIRGKLLLGLGVISKDFYDDIDIFVTLKKWVKIQDNEVSFLEADVIFELNKVHAIQKIMPIYFDNSVMEDLSESMHDMYIDNYTQKVISTITLAVTDMLTVLAKSNALTS